jgi:integrase
MLCTNKPIWIEKNKRWQVKVQKDNVRKTFYCSTPGKLGKSEVLKKANDWLSNTKIDPKKKVSETAMEYIEQLKLTTSKAHWSKYESCFRLYINPEIGTKRIADVTEQQLQTIINKAFSKGLAKKTLCNIRSCINAWIKFCRKSKYTPLFIEGLSVSKSAPSKKKLILLPEEVRILFSEDNTLYRGESVFDLYVNAYRFQVVLGLRPGELIGVKKEDIVNGFVYIKRSINTGNEITKGKNENALRDIKLTPLAVEILEAQYKLLEELGIESEYVFPTEHGEHLKEMTYYDRWIKYREHNGIKTPMPPYGFRHTFVSMVKTLPEGYLKQMVGHAEDMDTYGIYSHDFADDREKAANMVQDIFDNVLGKTI